MPHPNQEKACQLCERLPKLGTTKHHLIPRMCHSNKWFKKNFNRAQMQATVELCRQCHRAVHEFLPEKVLGKEFNTLMKLQDHPAIARYVGWVRKQR